MSKSKNKDKKSNTKKYIIISIMIIITSFFIIQLLSSNKDKCIEVCDISKRIMINMYDDNIKECQIKGNTLTRCKEIWDYENKYLICITKC